MQSKVVTKDFRKLNAFVKALSDKHVVQVGLFAPKAGRNEKGVMGNPDLGAIHEFGSFSAGIPARSWLRMPITKRTKELLTKASQGAKELLAAGKMVMVLQRMGIAAENVIQRAFSSQGFGEWKDNALSTVWRKGSSRPLIDTGQLRRSVTSRVAEAV